MPARSSSAATSTSPRASADARDRRRGPPPPGLRAHPDPMKLSINLTNYSWPGGPAQIATHLTDVARQCRRRRHRHRLGRRPPVADGPDRIDRRADARGMVDARVSGRDHAAGPAGDHGHLGHDPPACAAGQDRHHPRRPLGRTGLARRRGRLPGRRSRHDRSAVPAHRRAVQPTRGAPTAWRGEDERRRQGWRSWRGGAGGGRAGELAEVVDLVVESEDMPLVARSRPITTSRRAEPHPQAQRPRRRRASATASRPRQSGGSRSPLRSCTASPNKAPPGADRPHKDLATWPRPPHLAAGHGGAAVNRRADQVNPYT